MPILIKRVYEDPSNQDGYRILVDRLWPRGIKKDDLPLDEWCKEITPSTQLRREFHARHIDQVEFQERYLAELEGSPDLARIATIAQSGQVTLLIAGRDVQNSHAHVLREAIEAAG